MKEDQRTKPTPKEQDAKKTPKKDEQDQFCSKAFNDETSRLSDKDEPCQNGEG